MAYDWHTEQSERAAEARLADDVRCAPLTWAAIRAEVDVLSAAIVERTLGYDVLDWTFGARKSDRASVRKRIAEIVMEALEEASDLATVEAGR